MKRCAVFKWSDLQEYRKIKCPMLDGYEVMTYYSPDRPAVHAYSAPVLEEDGLVVYYIYDQDEGSWNTDECFIVATEWDGREEFVFDRWNPLTEEVPAG